MSTTAATPAAPEHRPQWEWQYIPVERLDFRIVAHDISCAKADEIYMPSQDFPKALKLYYFVAGRADMLPVVYQPALDLPMSRFCVYRGEGYGRTLEHQLLWSDMESMPLSELRRQFVLMAQIDVREDITVLEFDEKRGFTRTRKMESVEEYVNYFMKGLSHLRAKHEDLKLQL